MDGAIFIGWNINGSLLVLLLSNRPFYINEIRRTRFVCIRNQKAEGGTSMEIHQFDPTKDDVKTVRETRALERELSFAWLQPDEMMERAGSAITAIIKSQFPQGTRVTVLAGTGNNGGDGWVCARECARDGYPCTLLTQKHADDLRANPAKYEATITEAASHDDQNLTIVYAPDSNQVESAIAQSTVVVDAVLGTGFSGDTVKEPFASWIRAANAAHQKADAGTRCHIACDIPSGMNADTGACADVTFACDQTVTMLAGKKAMTTDALSSMGTVFLATLV